MTREETRAAAQWVYRQAYDTNTNFTFEHLLTQARILGLAEPDAWAVAALAVYFTEEDL